MIEWLDTLGYRLTMRGDWISDLWSRIWFRWRCPYPIIADHSARACIESGNCGCDNGPRNARPLDKAPVWDGKITLECKTIINGIRYDPGTYTAAVIRKPKAEEEIAF